MGFELDSINFLSPALAAWTGVGEVTEADDIDLESNPKTDSNSRGEEFTQASAVDEERITSQAKAGDGRSQIFGLEIAQVDTNEPQAAVPDDNESSGATDVLTETEESKPSADPKLSAEDFVELAKKDPRVQKWLKDGTLTEDYLKQEAQKAIDNAQKTREYEAFIKEAQDPKNNADILKARLKDEHLVTEQTIDGVSKSYIKNMAKKIGLDIGNIDDLKEGQTLESQADKLKPDQLNNLKAIVNELRKGPDQGNNDPNNTTKNNGLSDADKEFLQQLQLDSEKFNKKLMIAYARLKLQEERQKWLNAKLAGDLDSIRESIKLAASSN